MELVHGVPITQYCDQQHLTPKERLDLFIPVCHAVQHAHQKEIIHRDLKPSNVLIALYDDRPVPKVIDFGVAKATTQKLTEKTMFTQFGQVVGTLEYMSPEQANLNQLDVDTRSDIYSLGVLLYELLTGTTPFDRQRLRSAAFDEMLRIIREEEPPKPSTRLSTIDTLPAVAANRKVKPKKLSTLVRGELDWIVMKSLEKDRTRRYETANGLANDIQRYLNDEAVVACPPSAMYRFRKFARKNKRLLLTTAVIAVALLVGTAVATWQAVRATQAQHLAEQARESQEAQKRQAEANMNLAYQALDKIYLQVVEQDLVRYPERLDSYRRVLEDALKFYRAFAERNADDERVKYELAVALARAGKLAALLGQHQEALDHLRKARSILEPLQIQAPTQSDYRRTLFGIYRRTTRTIGTCSRRSRRNSDFC
jgi:eukaryotic-like serine/threonine-protein kinase